MQIQRDMCPASKPTARLSMQLMHVEHHNIHIVNVSHQTCSCQCSARRQYPSQAWHMQLHTAIYETVKAINGHSIIVSIISLSVQFAVSTRSSASEIVNNLDTPEVPSSISPAPSAFERGWSTDQAVQFAVYHLLGHGGCDVKEFLTAHVAQPGILVPQSDLALQLCESRESFQPAQLLRQREGHQRHCNWHTVAM